MQYISATAAKMKLAAMLDAAQSEPIMIRRQNRDAAVVISPKEYERLRRLDIEEFQEFREKIAKNAAKRGLTEARLKALLDDTKEA